METFCLIEAGDQMIRWCILTSNTKGDLVWLDMKSATTPYEDGTVLAHMTCQSIHETFSNATEEVIELEKAYANRFLLDPWALEGWLAPNGKFWGCGFFKHDDIALALIRKSTGQLENEGWIRVHTESFKQGDVLREPTKRQYATLERMGFIDLQSPGVRSSEFSVDRGSPAPSFAVKPPERVVLPHEVRRRNALAEARKLIEQEAQASLERLVERLRGFEVMRELLSVEHKLIPDVGPGTWQWMIQWDEFSIGSGDTPDELLDFDGWQFERSAFDTFELHGRDEFGLWSDPSEEMYEIARTLENAGKNGGLVDEIRREGETLTMAM